MTRTAGPRAATLGGRAGRLDGTEATTVVSYQADAPNGPDIVSWLATHRAALLEELDTYGAVLVRDAVDNAELLNAAATEFGGELLTYQERSTPRTQIAGNVYTSTEYPANQTIAQHNESAYSANYPRWLFFACANPAATGGETPVADSRSVLDRLPADLIARFRDKGVLYTRAYREGMGLTWQESFQTRDRADVERYCRASGIEFTWVDDDGLRTRHRRPAVLVDPLSGRECWFNQAHLFHVANLPAETRAVLLDMFEEPDLPRAAYFGDGTPISDAEIATINAAFTSCCYSFPWARGDLLLVNNILMSHGRAPYTGVRSTLVAMAGTGSD